MANFLKNFVSSLKKPQTQGSFQNPFSVLGTKPKTQAPQYNSQTAPLMQANPIKPTVPPSSTGATNPTKTTITPPKSTSGSTLPPAGQQYAASIANAPQIPPVAPQTAPTTSPTAQGGSSSQSAYLKYLTGMFDPNSVESARSAQESSLKRLGDIQKNNERQAVQARENYEKELMTSGRQQSANDQAASTGARRASAESAYGAIEENAAARSAQVAQDTYKSYLDAGKTVYEAEQAAVQAGEKSKQQEFENDLATKKFDEDKRQFGLEYALAQQKASADAGGGASNKVLSVDEAKSLGVPYGTTEAQAAAMNKRPLSPAQQTSQNNANSALLSLSTLTNAIKNPDGTYKNMKLVTFGIGKIAQSQREIKDVISRIRTGAALTENEEKFYDKQVPNKYDSDATAQQKINQLAAFFSGISGSPVTLELPDGSVVVADDMFDETTRTDVRKAIASGANVIDY